MMPLRWIAGSSMFVPVFAASVWSQSPKADDPLRLMGQVLNHLGAGIHDAEITAHLQTEDDAPPKQLANTRSTALGDFEFELSRALKGTVVVTVKKEGFAPFTHEYDLSQLSEDDFVEAVLDGAAKVRGRVVEADGQTPVMAARLTASLGGRQLKAVAASDGRFEISGIPPSGGQLIVEADGFGKEKLPIDATKLSEPVVVTVKPERVLSIKVTEERTPKPIPNTFIEVILADGSDHRTIRTGPDGVAVIRGLNQTADRMRVRLTHDEYVKSGRFSDEVVVDAGELSPGITLTMVRGAKIVGRITGPDDEPLFGARVVAGSGPDAYVPAQFSALDGSFQLTGLLPGRALITVHHGFHAPHLEQVDVDIEKPMRLDVQLERGERIVARILDPDGKPLADVRAVSTEWKGHDTLRIGGVSDADGRIEVEHVPPGQIRFRLFTLEVPALQEVVMQAGRTDYTFTVDPTAAAAQPAGAPPSGAMLAAGADAPAFNVTTLAGQAISLDSLRGRYVFLDFWATWCGPCVAEIPVLKRLEAATRERDDFVMLGVSLDQDPATVERFLRQREVSWPQVVGQPAGAARTAAAFQVSAIPSTFLIGPDGKILASGLRGEGLVDAVNQRISPQN